VIELFPIPQGFNITPEAWAATPAVMQSEICRAHREISQGIAIAKDVRCGRPKAHRRPASAPAPGFYALHRLELEIARKPDDAALQAKAEEMREALAPDVTRMAENDDMQEFEQYARREHGMTLPEYIKSRAALEQLIRRDPIEGIAQVCEMIGRDP
jgi:hypothetical protein